MVEMRRSPKRVREIVSERSSSIVRGGDDCLNRRSLGRADTGVCRGLYSGAPAQCFSGITSPRPIVAVAGPGRGWGYVGGGDGEESLAAAPSRGEECDIGGGGVGYCLFGWAAVGVRVLEKVYAPVRESIYSRPRFLVWFLSDLYS